MEIAPDVPYITVPELRVLRAAEGLMEISVLRIEEYYVPFVHFTPRWRPRVDHGVIMNRAGVLASPDLEDVIMSVRDLVGPFIHIVPPDRTPAFAGSGGETMH